MLWVYGHYKYVDSYSAGIDFSQNLRYRVQLSIIEKLLHTGFQTYYGFSNQEPIPQRILDLRLSELSLIFIRKVMIYPNFSNDTERTLSLNLKIPSGIGPWYRCIYLNKHDVLVPNL